MRTIGLVRCWVTFALALSFAACGGPEDDVVDPGTSAPADLFAFPIQGVDAAGKVTTLLGRLELGTGAPVDEVRGFLASAAPALQLRADLADLVLDREVADRGGSTFRFRQTQDGVPVFEGELVVGVDPGGAIIHVRNDYEPAAATVPTAPTVSAADAVRIAEAAVGARFPATVAPSLTIVRGGKGAPGLYLAWLVAGDVRAPRADWRVFVDAATGDVVRTLDMLKWTGAACTACNPATDTGCGLVLHENAVDKLDNVALVDTSNVDAAQQGCLLGNLTSTTNLAGTYVNTSITAGTRAAPPYNVLRSVNQNFVDEINAYYHINRSKTRLDTLGYPSVMSFSINTDAHDPTLGDNAHYVPSTKIIEFGIGGVDDAQDADVAYHEYGHAIQDNQVPGYGSTEEGGAAGEGFGDYWAASITDDSSTPLLGTACLGAWDATAYFPYNPAQPGSGCLRRLDGTKLYPRDQDFEVHDDGEMWAAALWRLRTAIGGDTTDALVIKGHTFLTSSAKFINLADGLISADAALNGGANAAAIHAAMVTGGIPRTGTADAAAGPVNTVAFSCQTAHPYTNNTYKECTFTQPNAQWIRVHFSAFATEAGWDYAYVSDASFRQVQALNGSLGAFTSAAVTGDTIVVRFKADTTVTANGFTIDQVQYGGCTSAAQCSDGNACNGAEVCTAGVCGAGTAPTCDDGNGCTTDGCSPASGCTTTPVANGTACADGTVCNGAETCQAGSCATGTPLSCDDSNVCTADACDAVTGCVATPVADGTACGDADACNGVETCQAGGCAAGTPLSCDDGDACTADSCDASAGCGHAPICTTLATDGFEGKLTGGTGWAGPWTVAGDATVVRYPHTGIRSGKLRTASGRFARTVNLAGVTGARLRFWAQVFSFEGADHADVRVSSDGVNYTTVRVFTSANSDSTWHAYDVDLSGFAMTSAFTISFDAGMSGTGDRFYIDDVELLH